MKILDQIKKIFQFGKAPEALQIAYTNPENDSKRFNNSFESLQSAQKNVNDNEEYKNFENQSINSPNINGIELTQIKNKMDDKSVKPEPIELQKESLQLGVAAGYTGRSILEIERSLARIEDQMITKDWYSSTQEQANPRMVELLIEIRGVLEQHNQITTKRHEIIEAALSRLMSASDNAPGPIKKVIEAEIGNIRSTLPLSSKMKRLVDLVKDTGQISYDELGIKLELSRPALRGLLTNTMKRTTDIERYSVDNKGWVRYIRTSEDQSSGTPSVTNNGMPV